MRKKNPELMIKARERLEVLKQLEHEVDEIIFALDERARNGPPTDEDSGSRHGERMLQPAL